MSANLRVGKWDENRLTGKHIDLTPGLGGAGLRVNFY